MTAEDIYIPNIDFCIKGPKSNPKQLEFLEATYSGKFQYLAYGGAIRGGKTYMMLFILHTLAMTYPKSRWAVVRASLPVLKGTTIKSFNKLITTSAYGKWNLSTNTFTYHNGSEIIFKPESKQSDPELTDFLGWEGNGIFLEQAEELSELMWQRAIERTGSLYIDNMPPGYIFLTFNPTQNWVKQKFYEPWKEGTLPEGYYFQSAVPTDNKFVTEAQFKQWQNLDERYRLQMIEGDWTDFGDQNGLWAFSFSRTKHVRKALLFPALSPAHTVYLSFDFNKNPICCSVIQHVDDQIRVHETIKLANSDIYEMCKYITVNYSKYMLRVTGDASGNNLSAMVKDNLNYYRIIKKELHLLDQLIDVPTANPRLEDNQVLVNSLLSKYNVIIHEENCKSLIYDLGNVKMLADGSIKKADRNDPAQQADALDTFRYYCNQYHKRFLTML